MCFDVHAIQPQLETEPILYNVNFLKQRLVRVHVSNVHMIFFNSGSITIACEEAPKFGTGQK